MLIRKATQKDLPDIVALLADDKLGKIRENFKIPLPKEYEISFDKIIRDTNQELVVLEDQENQIIGTLQLTFIPYLTYQGGTRAQIEAVRIKESHRGKGLGGNLFTWAIQRAQQRKAHVIQLTTDKKRPEAIIFYEKLGFKKTHEGMKLHF